MVDVTKHRTLWYVAPEALSPDSTINIIEEPEERKQVETLEEATLIGSLANRQLAPGRVMHYPAIDIDLPVMVIESSPGKSHLYIEKAMTWEQYVVLLQAMVYAGIVERGYFDTALIRGQTFLRKPGLTKGGAA